ncbi:MAG: tetratricopeptide repeat protein [Candidatus Thiodiazotropha sp.]
MENQLHIHHEHKQNGGKEKPDDAHGSAHTYHNLGRIAQEKEDFDSAESWYKNPGDQEKTG